jgi:uncharacterized membrane protein YadS
VFWKLVSGITRTSLAINKTVSALGLAIVIGVAVHDFLKQRKKEDAPLRRFD